jgi:hypothetical protein
MTATTAFAYKAGTGKGCLADHIKQATGTSEWFEKLKTLDDLPRWWRMVVPEIDVILSVSDTSIKALTTWHATAPGAAYPLNAMEDMYLRKVVMIHCAAVPELKAGSFRRDRFPASSGQGRALARRDCGGTRGFHHEGGHHGLGPHYIQSHGNDVPHAPRSTRLSQSCAARPSFSRRLTTSTSA